MVSKIFYNTVIVSKIWTTGYWLIVLSVVTCDGCKPMNSCRDWAFSNSGLEVGLPDFQLLMFTKCNALPKGDMVSKIFTIQWLCPRFGLQDIDCLCSQLWHVTAANQWTVVEIDLAAIAGWKWGCQTFMVGKCAVLPKRDIYGLQDFYDTVSVSKIWTTVKNWWSVPHSTYPYMQARSRNSLYFRGVALVDSHGLCVALIDSQTRCTVQIGYNRYLQTKKGYARQSG